MSQDRYRPRSFAFDDQLFGKQRNIRWRDSEELTDAELDQQAASRMQHDVAYSINEALEKSGRFFSAADYAREIDVSPRRMTALLRGDIVMRLEDVAAAERILRISHSPNPGRQSDS